MKKLNKYFAPIVAAFLAAACSGNHQLLIGSADCVDPSIDTYDGFVEYVSKLDGFVCDSAELLNPLLADALKDGNIPLAPASEIYARAELFHHAKALMDDIIVLDTHCDFPEQIYYNPDRGYSLGESRSRCQLSLQKMRQGHMSAQYLSVWMNAVGDQKDTDLLAKAPDVLWEFIRGTDEHLELFRDQCGKARTRQDVETLKSQGKIAFLSGLENAFWIGTDLSNVKRLADHGFTYITLCHWGDNQVCNSCDRTSDKNGGLTEFGVRVVEEMNRLGLVVDLSHASYGTWQQVLELSKAPVVFTHSGSAAVYDHQRNVDDATLKKLALNGGVIQVFIVGGYMSPDKERKASLQDLMLHIDHIVSVAGIDHVGIGLDFDGGGGGEACNGCNDAVNITMALIERGYSDEDITKIWGGNYLRVLDEVQRVAQTID